MSTRDEGKGEEVLELEGGCEAGLKNLQLPYPRHCDNRIGQLPRSIDVAGTAIVLLLVNVE